MEYVSVTENLTTILEGNKTLRVLYKYEKTHPCGYFWKYRVVIDTMFVYHFVEPDVRIEIFEKEG